MRDEKEERKKQARSNKQTRQGNTAHPRQSLWNEPNIYVYTYMYEATGHNILYIRTIYIYMRLPIDKLCF